MIIEHFFRYKTDIKNARFKDIERILFTLYIFNYNPKNIQFYNSAINELLDSSRKKELDRYLNS